jgi:hypothetical protein
MPLVLNPDACRRPVTLLWDPHNTQEVREAKEHMACLCAEGLVIQSLVSAQGEARLRPKKALPASCVIFRVLSENGDDVIVWDRRDLEQVQEAKVLFNEYQARGFRAYVLRADGEKGSRVDSFDALLEAVIVSKTGKAYETVLVPKTHPG